jgi:uncharacterized protein YbaP (TraB family)
VFLVLISLSTHSAISEELANIQDISYTVDDTVKLHAVIASSFNRETFLLLEAAQEYSPDAIATKTFRVDAGSKVQTIELQLKPASNQKIWSVRVSLYLSNVNSQKMELLQYKVIEIDLTQRSFDWGPLGLGLACVIVLGILIQRETIRRKNRADWRQHKMKRKHRT